MAIGRRAGQSDSTPCEIDASRHGAGDADVDGSGPRRPRPRSPSDDPRLRTDGGRRQPRARDPASGSGGDGTDERPSYPALREEIGEDPARYLPFDAPDPSHYGGVLEAVGSPLLLPLARICGIDRLRVAAAWQGVVRECRGDPLDPEIADQLLAALGERVTHLEDHGERPPPDDCRQIANLRRAQGSREPEAAESRVDRLQRRHRRGEPLSTREKRVPLANDAYHDPAAGPDHDDTRAASGGGRDRETSATASDGADGGTRAAPGGDDDNGDPEDDEAQTDRSAGKPPPGECCRTLSRIAPRPPSIPPTPHTRCHRHHPRPTLQLTPTTRVIRPTRVT